ncbi:hypothetical protein [Streptomyces sp. NPDC014006]|uniref:SEL1-like repeat protein n=1 Tax=Streptomyces sp. NPDC014006 TaxID=3364870 RepID=UPI0036F964E9
MRRTAAQEPGTATADGLGRPIGQWDPHALEVHPASSAQDGSGSPGQRLLPGYVPREHDRILAEVVRDAATGRSRMLVLVGASSTGKTRACWEAVQPLAEQGWRLWHPFAPTRARAALEDLHRVGPRTVVWLNEAQHYLGDREAGEEIAAAVHGLLTSPQRGPVLALGTLWDDYVKQYTALPLPGGPDPHSRVRELLAGRTVSVPDAFDVRALAAATALAEDGDRLLADALTRARTDGRLTQDLAGGPALLERYRTASPAAKALLEAAMDARRLGVGLHLPQAFLTDAVPDYLHDTDWNQLTDDWAERAYTELAERVHGKQAPLSRVTPRPQRRPPSLATPADVPSSRSAGPVFRLADYLEQHGRTTRRHLCPPASFWHAAHTHLSDLDDLRNLARGAGHRQRLQWAHHLWRKVADAGDPDALLSLARIRRDIGDLEGAETLVRQAADSGSPFALVSLVTMLEESGDPEQAEIWARQAADAGDTSGLAALMRIRGLARGWEDAEALARHAVDAGDPNLLTTLAFVRELAGDLEGATVLYRQAIDAGDMGALTGLARIRGESGDLLDSEALYWQAVDAGDIGALTGLAQVRERAGDLKGAETLYERAADAGDATALTGLARIREQAGDREGAAALYQRAVDAGDISALISLAHIREQAKDRKGAETLACEAAEAGIPFALTSLLWEREQAGDREGVEALYQRAADAGRPDVLADLARMREQAGDWEGAEALYQRAADAGDPSALTMLAWVRKQAGDWEGAEALYRQAADASDSPLGTGGRQWLYGLDPDGSHTPPWH